MTPLAHYLAKLLTMPIAKRHRWADPESSRNLRDALQDIHCFECTAIKPIIQDFGTRCRDMGKAEVHETFGNRMFLPAPKTWIEMTLDPAEPGDRLPNRVAWLIQEHPNKKQVVFSLWVATVSETFARLDLQDGLFAATGFEQNPKLPKIIADGVPSFFWSAIYSLILINTPRIIGRRTFFPHRGLERRLTRAFGPGKFPLHAWTDIMLEVSKPPEVDDGDPHESHLTGRRALHFCRKHLRIRYGQLEYVSAHWRGDPAIGIKRSRYIVHP